LPATPTPQASAAQPAQPGSSFYGIDFNDTRRWVRIRITPPDRSVNGGRPIVLAFIPGTRCVFGDNRACVSSLANGASLLTIHSGLGGEAEALRHALEGTGWDQAAYSLRQVRANLEALRGAAVVITQGKRRVEGLVLGGLERIPPAHVRSYFKTSLPEVLGLAASLEPNLQPYLAPQQPILVFETCGWRVSSERWAKGTTSTSASIYLGVIQKKP
jgi:hypothetical protein